MNNFAKKLDELIQAGRNSFVDSDYKGWASRVAALLATAIDTKTAVLFEEASTADDYWRDKRDRQIGHLEGLALRLDASALQQAKAEHLPVAHQIVTSMTNRVFLVHGHDSASKETVARFIEKLGLQVVILHEQPNGGRTVIEKFEAYSDVSFAIVLMTPDDVGSTSDSMGDLKPRARQNVILELGYFTGRIGRSKVCALFKQGIEIPSDIHGVLFLELDGPGAWKPKLANELVRAGMKIDVQALLSG